MIYEHLQHELTKNFDTVFSTCEKVMSLTQQGEVDKARFLYDEVMTPAANLIDKIKILFFAEYNLQTNKASLGAEVLLHMAQEALKLSVFVKSGPMQEASTAFGGAFPVQLVDKHAMLLWARNKDQDDKNNKPRAEAICRWLNVSR